MAFFFYKKYRVIWYTIYKIKQGGNCMLFQTTTAHEELRAKVRAFAEEEIKPIAFQLDKENEFPDEAIKKIGKLGLMGMPYPKEYGGAGLDALSYAIAILLRIWNTHKP